jgi:cytochrome c peroxidase
MFLILGVSSVASSQDRDGNRKTLRDFVRENEFKPIQSEPFEVTKKYILGQALFFDPILSTNNDISCATCHLVSNGTSDGLPKSLGTGGDGLGKTRLPKEIEERDLRNTQALWNRDDKSVISLFWDGRVEMLDPKDRVIRSPLKDLLPKSIENVLAAQALFPLVNAGEMFAHNCSKGEDGCLIDSKSYKTPEWISAVHTDILLKILGGQLDAKSMNAVQTSYRELFKAAYPKIPLKEIEVGLVGNAIAHFEEVAFATRDARWDKYIRGDDNALSESEVKGALLFYGKGQCYSCHRGAVFSDYLFHSLGIVSYKSKEKELVDYGRYGVTGVMSDKFRFRTPALRNVTITGPYMHDGSVDSLSEAIEIHVNSDCRSENGLEVYCDENQRSELLQSIGELTGVEKGNILDFLFALEDDASDYHKFIIPSSVPSGLPVHGSD